MESEENYYYFFSSSFFENLFHVLGFANLCSNIWPGQLKKKIRYEIKTNITHRDTEEKFDKRVLKRQIEKNCEDISIKDETK